MHILVTNDDGIHSPALMQLKQQLAGLGTVTVIAPDRNQSATSQSLTRHRPLRIHPHGDEVYSVDGTPAHGYLRSAYQQQGRYAQAIAEIRRALELSGGSPRYLANLGVAQALSGDQHAARQTLAELLRLNKQQHIQPFHLASVYMALDGREQAFAWLEKAYQERGVWLLFLHLDPLFDRLRSDARFTDLLSRVGLLH